MPSVVKKVVVNKLPHYSLEFPFTEARQVLFCSSGLQSNRYRQLYGHHAFGHQFIIENE